MVWVFDGLITFRKMKRKTKKVTNFIYGGRENERYCKEIEDGKKRKGWPFVLYFKGTKVINGGLCILTRKRKVFNINPRFFG